jgi:hypothetical protein
VRADYVIWTSGTMQETSVQVDELVVKLERRLEPGTQRLPPRA